MTTQLRELRETDLPSCMRLKEAAGWNQTAADWLALLRWSPHGCFCMEEDGRVVATATAMAYPWNTGWIGMVLTDPASRGRGYATRLLARCIEWLDEQGIATVKLDATELGEPLYRKLGFKVEAPIERWRREPAPLEPAHVSGRYPGPLRHPAVPVDDMAETENAWAAGREGSSAWYFGPCYGTRPDDVERVARALIAPRAGGPVFWDLFPSHPAAGIASRLGFQPARRLLRMVRGRRQESPADVYAIAGFEWG